MTLADDYTVLGLDKHGQSAEDEYLFGIEPEKVPQTYDEPFVETGVPLPTVMPESVLELVFSQIDHTPKTANQLFRSLGVLRRPAVHRSLSRLYQQGRIDRVRDGGTPPKYVLPPCKTCGRP